MVIIISLSYIVANLLLAHILTKCVTFTSEYDENNVDKFITFTVFFFTFFLGSIHIIGYINLATDLKVVNYINCFIVALLFVLGAGLLLKRKSSSNILIPDMVKYRAFIPWLFSLNRRSIRLLVIVFTCAFLFIAMMLVFGYPLGWEAKAYHLPIGLHMFQSQSLQVWDNSATHTVPVNMSIYSGFLLGFASEHLVSIANYIFLLPFVLAVYGMSRETGADQAACVLTSLGFLTVPVIVAPAFSLAADLGGITFISIAVYFALRRSNYRQMNFALSGLAAGLSFGFKSLHLMSISILFVLIIINSWNAPETNRSTESYLRKHRPAVIFLLFSFITSGFWLVRNYVLFDNPLYPVHIPLFDLFGWEKAPDYLEPQVMHSLQFNYVRSPLEWFIYPWTEWRFAKDAYFGGVSRLGPFFAATVPIACLMSLAGVITRKDEKWILNASLLGGGFFVLFVWWIMDDRQPRYFLGALVFFAPLVAWTINQTKGGARKIFEGIIMFCMVSSLLFIFSKRVYAFAGIIYNEMHVSRQIFYGYPKMIDVLPPGSTIVNLGQRDWNYPLYGERFQNRVVSYRKAKSIVKFGKISETHKNVYLQFPAFHKLRATHIFTSRNWNFMPGECISLKEIDRIEILHGHALPVPRRLFEIEYCKGTMSRSTD